MTDNAIDATIVKRVEAALAKNPKRTRQVEAAAKVKAKANGHGTAAAVEPWRPMLLRTRQKEVRDCLANVTFVLRLDPSLAGRLRYDEMLEAAVTRDMPWAPGGEWREWTDTDDLRLAAWCQERGVTVRPGTVADGVAVVSDQHRCHPLREYLGDLSWDGGERISTFARDYLGAEDGPYARTVVRAWMISAVARAFEPGCKVDNALILEGDQGIGKSSAFAALCRDPSWFTDGVADLGTKDSAQDLRGKWIVELAELAAMKKGEVERTKHYISKDKDHYRPSYGRRSRDFARQNVFGGTTNSSEYLRDETGNRRFYPLSATAIDLAGIRRDRDQLWAEAVAAYRAGEQWWLEAKMEELAKEEQELRREADPWEDTVLTWLENRTAPVMVRELLDMMKLPPEQQQQVHSNRMVKILKLAGWTRRQRRIGHARIKFYYPPGSDPDDPTV